MQVGYRKIAWVIAAWLAACGPAMAQSHGRSGKLDSYLGSHGPSGEAQPVIVTVRAGANKADVLQRLQGQGAKIERVHDVIHALTVRVDAGTLQALASDPDVQAISTDADMSADATTSSDTSYYASNLQQRLAIQNWFSGSSVTIAMIDSGIAPTADFTGRILATYDFTGGSNGTLVAPLDGYGHGTHVAGLAGSSGFTSNGTYAGVAPGVKFLSLRVLDNKGAGKTSAVIAALQFAVANKALYNIRIINLSLGHPIYESAVTDPLVQAVEAAVRAGIVVCVAAGNVGINPATGGVGYGGITSPGNSPSAITVGASVDNGTIERWDDRVASFSSRGPSWFDGYGKPDVVAPGTSMLSDEVDGSTLAVSYPQLVYPTMDGKLLKLSGSSMATAVVSGLAAVMMEAHDYGAQQRYQSSWKNRKLSWYVPPPLLTPNDVKMMLQYSATPLRDANGLPYDALTEGTGEIDGLGSLTLAYYADTAQPIGATWMPTVNAQTQFGTDVETWAQTIVWGTRRVTGTGIIQVNQPAWPAAVVWGSGELDDIVWGTIDESDNIVWGSAAVLSDVVWAGSVLEQHNIVWGSAITTWAPNIVWGTGLIGTVQGTDIVWGSSCDPTVSSCDNIVWGSMAEADNIVWGSVEYDNIVWGSANLVASLDGGVQ